MPFSYHFYFYFIFQCLIFNCLSQKIGWDFKNIKTTHFYHLNKKAIVKIMKLKRFKLNPNYVQYVDFTLYFSKFQGKI